MTPDVRWVALSLNSPKFQFQKHWLPLAHLSLILMRPKKFYFNSQSSWRPAGAQIFSFVSPWLYQLVSYLHLVCCLVRRKSQSVSHLPPPLNFPTREGWLDLTDKEGEASSIQSSWFFLYTQLWPSPKQAGLLPTRGSSPMRFCLHSTHAPGGLASSLASWLSDCCLSKLEETWVGYSLPLLH